MLEKEHKRRLSTIPKKATMLEPIERRPPPTSDTLELPGF
jgi:hypothetical protein